MKVWIHVHDAPRASGPPLPPPPARRICWYVGTSDAQVLSAARLQLQLPADAEFLLRDGDGDLVPIASTLPHDQHFSLVLAEHLITAAAHSEASSAAAECVTTAASAAGNKRPSDSVLASAAAPTPTQQPAPESDARQSAEASAAAAISEAALTAGDLSDQLHLQQQLQHKRRKVKSHSSRINEHAAVVNGGGSDSVNDASSSSTVLHQPVAAVPLTSILAASPQPAPTLATTTAIATTAAPVVAPVVSTPARARSIATIVTQFLETFTKPILNDDNVNFIPNTGKYGLYALYSEIVADPSFHPKGQDAFYKMTAMQGKVDRQRVIRFYQDRQPSGSVEYVQYKPQGKGPFLRKYLVVESERTMQELIKSAGFVVLMDLEPEQVVAKYLSFVKGFRPISKADYRAHQNGDDGQKSSATWLSATAKGQQATRNSIADKQAKAKLTQEKQTDGASVSLSPSFLLSLSLEAMLSSKKMVQLLLLSVGALALCASLVEAIVAGVDFGGEFFKIALVKPGTPFEIVTNVHSKRKTETMVAFDGDERLYGADAATVAVRRPQTAYSQIRRFLGATPDHPQVVSLLQEEYFPYTLLQNATRGTISLEHDNKKVFHAEELVAMVFSHARQITDAFAEAPVKDWVITVPSFFSQAQRQAMLDAAEISGVRVLSLINENTAAALQHAVHSTFTEPRKILFYNMGSTSLQVSITEFKSEVVPDGFKKNKTVSGFQVLANAWDENLGGAKFDLQLAEHLAKEFNKKLGNGEDIRTIPRPLAKIRAQAKKTKIVLSANEEIPVVMQSLYKDMDFFTSMTRSKFEEINADLFARSLEPVKQALAKAGLTASDIDEIEIVGGGVRMPKIQAQLKEFFSGKDLGVHLNGDEAMALGSAFRAANLSNSFRVRHVGMTDIGSFPVGVRLVDLEHGNVAEKKDEKEDGEDAKHWVKRAALFSESSRLGLRKAVSFLHSEDISCTFRYDKPSALPAGVNVHIGKYNITGIKEFAESVKDKNLGEPKVTLSFELDSNGIAKIAKAEATLEEEYEVEVEVKKPKKDKKKKDKKADGSKEDAKEDEDEKEDEEPAVKETVKEMRKKTHRAALTVVLGHDVHDNEAGMSVLPMSIATKKESIRILREMEQADNQRKANLEAKNRLETFVYNARDTLLSKQEQMAQVTQPEQLEKLQSKLEETEEWLYDDGEKVDAAEYNKKVKDLDKDLSAILFRVAELKDFPVAINSAEEYAFSTRELMAEWVESKPQVTEDERKDVLEKVEELEAWLVSSQKKQKAASAFEDPVVTSADVNKKVQGVKKLVATLSKKPKPAPVKTEEDEKKDNSTTEASEEDDKKTKEDGEAADKKEDSDKAATKKEEEVESEDDKVEHEEL